MFDWQNRTDRRAKKEVETTIQKDERRLAMPPKVEATIVVQKCPSSKKLLGVRIQKKEDGRADENDTQYTVEQAGLSPPYILYDKLGVSGSKEPVPVQYGCQQGDDACDGENPLNDVLAHQK